MEITTRTQPGLDNGLDSPHGRSSNSAKPTSEPAFSRLGPPKLCQLKHYHKPDKSQIIPVFTTSPALLAAKVFRATLKPTSNQATGSHAAGLAEISIKAQGVTWTKLTHPTPHLTRQRSRCTKYEAYTNQTLVRPHPPLTQAYVQRMAPSTSMRLRKMYFLFRCN